MKLAWIGLLALTLPALAGCVNPADVVETADIDPTTTDTPDRFARTFNRDLPDVISKLEPLAQAADVPGGSGIWLHGNYAYVGGRGTGFHVVDVTEPEKPVMVGSLANDIYARDVDVLTYPDGRVVAVIASAGAGMNFIDVTDPTDPTLIGNVEPPRSGTHNVAVLPGTHLVFNSASNGQGGKIQVVDASDPSTPTVISEWGTHGCHDITFFISEDKKRAYCPGIQETNIWDIEDPLDGKHVASITNDFITTGGLHHLAIVNEDASLLILGDEFMGGSGPGCHVNVADKSTTSGALWFYDITDEKNPKLLSWITPSAPVLAYVENQSSSCTAHFGVIIPDTEKLVMSWYRAGVILIDFADPANPHILDQWNEGTNMWDVQYANGYLFTGDMFRGLDVLTLG